MSGSLQRAMYLLAEDQFGFVTTRMARDAGIPARQLAQLATRGVLERISYGVYRMVDFPSSPLDSYMAATLWPQGATAVLSHDTALDLFEVCDINPVKIHITVPSAHRIRREVPALYVIHHADLGTDETAWVEGIPVTSLLRTIVDCLNVGVGSYLLEQAVERGRALGKLTDANATAMSELIANRGREHANNG